MATANGKMKSTSRQGASGSQTFTFTITSDPDPPGTLITFDCDETYFGDAKDYLGKSVTVTFTPPPTGPGGTCTGLKGSAP